LGGGEKQRGVRSGDGRQQEEPTGGWGIDSYHLIPLTVPLMLYIAPALILYTFVYRRILLRFNP
jgi:hypothetical protein